MPISAEDQEILYKDLTHTTSIHLAAEQIFAYWDTIYALISGAFLTIYFTASSLGLFSRLVLCIVGAAVALSWHRVDRRCADYSGVRERRMARVAAALQRKIAVPSGSETAFSLLDEQKEQLHGKRLSFWQCESTWRQRLALSLLVFWTWLALSIYSCVSIVVPESWKWVTGTLR